MYRSIFWGLWLGFVLYAFILAPPNRPDTADLILRLSTGDWQGINPIVIALFNAMGIWPMVYAALALVDGAGQKLRAWPFVGASFAVGAFALLPYLALRQPNSGSIDAKSSLLRLLESRWLGAVLGAGAIALAAFALLNGDWTDFWQQWQTSRFIHVMSLDFCALWLLFPVLLRDDMARRGMTQGWMAAAMLALPLVGACLYLTLRPPLAEGSEAEGVAVS
ncbi:DUF2834 domain-containing protein [Leptolyngbya sp. KIOST-1]|uniref:DUF2834 domain-containing protein n=1 Tax=Leptolyngbya sp. KIOST-1 TaxID=1229172 RepID=UPI0005681ED4|nr:DUF2834 domain-containing protein [Leptolyngbya sp. KIOST-1]